MTTPEKPSQPTEISIGKSNINIGSIEGLVNVSEVHLNVSQEVIVTTEDKIYLSLEKHLKKMEKKRAWVTPLGLTLSFTLTLITSDFKNMLFGPAVWQAFFIIGAVASFIWLLFSIKDALSSARIEDVIAELKKDYKPKKTS